MLCLTLRNRDTLTVGPVWIDFREVRGGKAAIAIDAPQVYGISRGAPEPIRDGRAYRDLTQFSDRLAPELARMVKAFYGEPANFRFAHAATEAPPDKLTPAEVGTLQILAQTVLREIQRELTTP